MEQFMQFLKSYWWIILIVVLLVIVAVALVLILKKKKPGIKVDDAFIEKLLALFGSANNIAGVKVDNGRLKIEVKDLELVDLNGLKEASEAGVFVTGNTIKILFKLDSLTIKKYLDKRI